MEQAKTVDDLPTVEAVNPTAIPAKVQAEFSTLGAMPSDSAKELAKLEAEINGQLQAQTANATPQETIAPVPTAAPVPDVAPPQPQQVQPTAQVQQPTQGVPVPPGIPVPEKFKNPDGTLNDERLTKSLVNLEHYINLEKQMHQKRAQEAAQPQMQTPPGYPQYPMNYPPQFQPQAEPFEARVSRDLQSDPGTTVVNLMRAAVSQAEQMTQNQTQELRRRLELMEIGQKDPAVFTTDGAQRLAKTLEDNPWLWNSPTPWANAYKLHGPINVKNGQGATVPLAANTVQAPARMTAPILPGGQPAPSIPTHQAPNVGGMSETDLRRYLNERLPNNPQAQADYLERIILAMNKQRRG